MIFAYNKQNVGDTLMVIVKNDENKENSVERKGTVARVQTTDGKTVAWNFFNVSDYLTIHGNGQVELSEKDIEVLNEQLKQSGFEERLVADLSPKFVVGYVKSCIDHPDSDHLHITETEIDGGETLQIRCRKAWRDDARWTNDLARQLTRRRKLWHDLFSQRIAFTKCA